MDEYFWWYEISTSLQYYESPSLSCTFALALPRIAPSLLPCCKREDKQFKKCESVKEWKKKKKTKGWKCKSAKTWKIRKTRKKGWKPSRPLALPLLKCVAAVVKEKTNKQSAKSQKNEREKEQKRLKATCTADPQLCGSRPLEPPHTCNQIKIGCH